MVLYVRDGVCYTKQEMKILIAGNRAKSGEFHPIKSREDLESCRDKLVDFDEPVDVCSAKMQRVIDRVEAAVELYNGIIEPHDSGLPRFYMTREIHDFHIIFSDLLPNFYAGRSYIQPEPLVKVLDKYGHVKLLLKCHARINGLDHSILFVISTIGFDVQEVEVVDVAPINFINNAKLLGFFKKQFGLNFSSAQIRYPMNELADEFGIKYDEPILSFQNEAEKSLAKKGYCNAWMLYFIYQLAKGKDIKEIYKRLILLETQEAVVAKIMRWWKKL